MRDATAHTPEVFVPDRVNRCLGVVEGNRTVIHVDSFVTSELSVRQPQEKKTRGGTLPFPLTLRPDGVHGGWNEIAVCRLNLAAVLQPCSKGVITVRLTAISTHGHVIRSVEMKLLLKVG